MKNQQDSDISQLRTLSVSDLQSKRLELAREQLNLKLQRSRLGETHKLRTVRRQIARIHTLLTEKTR